MAERADQLLKEEEELNKRRDALLFAQKDPDKAHEMGEELLDILKKKDALNKRAEKELARRKKIDNVCIPIIIIGFLTFLISGIISLASSSDILFPTVTFFDVLNKYIINIRIPIDGTVHITKININNTTSHGLEKSKSEPPLLELELEL